MVGASLFGGTMVLLYLASTLYHALPEGRAKTFFNRLDHAAIYVFIAGSYMPFLLGALGGTLAWTLFGVVWGAAGIGAAAKLFDLLRHRGWSTGLYLALGWVALAIVMPLFDRLPAASFGWLVAGGVSYSLGALVYLLDARVRFAHFVWHLFVLGGSGCHVAAALFMGSGASA